MKNKLIDKLNKKDKEELLSRIKEKNSKPYEWFGFQYLCLFFKYIILLSLVIPLWFIAFEIRHPELLIAGMSLFFVLVRVFVYVIILGFLLDYILFFIRRIKIIKIKKEYFEVIPKRK